MMAEGRGTSVYTLLPVRLRMAFPWKAGSDTSQQTSSK